MRRFISLIGAIGLSASAIVACSDEDLIVAPNRLRPEGSGGSGGVTGRAGSGSSDGSAGSTASSSAGRGGSAGGAAGRPGAAGSGGSSGDDGGSGPSSAEPDAGGSVPSDAGRDAGPLSGCEATADCDDSNPCTTDVCEGQVCISAPAAIGTTCGDTTTASECNQPDTCDANGVCLANTEPEGALCEDGHCNAQGACDCAVERVTAIPYRQQWQTTADTEADFYSECQECAGTLDHVVVFTAPTTASYRFSVTSGGDPELGVFDGDCSDALADASCGADVDPDSQDYADVLDLEIEAGATVTLVVGESCEENGGVGTLAIDLTPDGG